MQEGESKYGTLFDGMTQGVVCQNRDGEIISANPAAQRILGLSLDQMQGRTSIDPEWKAIHEDGSDFPGETHPAMVVLKTGQPVYDVIMGVYQPQTGKHSWISVDGIPQFEAGATNPHLVYTVFTDITQQKHADAALLENSANMSAIMENTKHSIWTINSSYEIVYVNSVFAEDFYTSFGVHLEPGVVLVDALPEALRPLWKERYDRTLANEQFEIVDAIDVGTHTVYIEVSFNPISVNGVVVGASFVGRDISQRKQEEENLVKLSKAIHNSSDAIFITDVEGIITFINPRFTKMYGFTAEEVVGKKTPRILNSKTTKKEDHKLLWNLLLDKRSIPNSEYLNKRKDGSLIEIEGSADPILDDNGELIGFLGIQRDNTKRKQAEVALKESEYLLRKSQLVAKLGSYVLDITEGHWVSSSALDDLFDIDAEYSRDISSWLQIVHPDDQEMMREYFTKDVLTNHNNFNKEYRIQRVNDKQVRWVQGIGELEFNTEGDPIKMMGVIQDITERKMAEAEHSRLEAQLHQSQKLEAIGTMVGGISHEFNNVLQSMFLHSGLVQDELPEDEELRSNFQHILDDGYRARALVKQILTFSRKTNVEMKPQALHELVKDVLVLERASMPANIDIIEDIDLNCGMVMCDKTQIQQIIINLCNNAQQAMEEKGGTLTVGLKQIQASIKNGDPEIDVLELMVRDTGHGIDELDLKKIFDPFFTTKKIGRGTGLGLSVIHGIVEMMDGKITATSKLEKGTAFRILFPVTVEAEEDEEVKSAGQVDVVSRSILLVDDEDSIRLATEVALTRKGFIVESAMDGKQALELFKANPDKYDLIITDQSMPNMSGVELTKSIRDTKSSIPIILSTGQLGIEDKKELKNVGITAFIQKPWTAASLTERIQDLDF